MAGTPAGPLSRLRSTLAAMRPDVTPLTTSRDYRLLYVASAVSLFGSMVTAVAAPLQMKELTGSTLAVGLIGLAELVPTIVFGLWGGAIADAHDRRRVLLLTEAASLLCSLVLAVNALLPHPSVAAIYVAAAGAAASAGVHRPSAEAMLARLLPGEQQAAAAALMGLQGTLGSILGPALGGLLAAASLPAAFLVDVASFAASLLLLARLAPMLAPEGAPPVTLSGIADGMRYALSRPDLLGTYAIDVAAMTFAMPQALYPFLADELAAPSALGLLYAAGAVGGTLVSLTGGWLTRVRKQGRAVVLAAAAWGACMAAAGAAGSLWAVLLCLAAAGAADMVSMVFRSAIWNRTIPNEMRGRLAGIELLSYTSGPTLGNARAGLMARLVGVRPAITDGGLLCVAAVAVTAIALPALWRQQAPASAPGEPASA